MEHFYTDIGEDWFNYSAFYREMVEQFDDAIFVEVGCWKGRSTSFLAVEILNSGKRIQLHCVDTWRGSLQHQEMDPVKNDTLYDEFLRNMEPVKSVITPLRMTSLEASRLYADGSLDFVFIDASHEYEDVMADLEAWYPKVRPGGRFSGHDHEWEGVRRALNEFRAGRGVDFITDDQSCWHMSK